MALNKAGQPIRWKERIGIIAVGHTAKTIETLLFDYVIYGTVAGFLMAKFGLVYGPFVTFIVMASASAIECMGLIALYNWVGKDLFGLEKIKEFRDNPENKKMRLAQRMMKMGDVLAFFAILFLHPLGDPFMVAVYLRKGNKMMPRDWKIFFAAIIVANAEWSFRWSVVLAFSWKVIWPLVKGIIF